MKYGVELRLPEGWHRQSSFIEDDNGKEAAHIEATSGKCAVDVFIGELPEDTTAEDQAFSNYADMVGFDDDDPDDTNPIAQIIFNGKKAWGFEAMCDDGTLVAVLAQEIKSGILALINVSAPDDATIQRLLQMVESGLRLKK